jgi:hypothetical protein
MPYQYPPAFRQDFIDLMLRGESVQSLAQESGVPLQTLHRWKARAFVDSGVRKGSTSRELSDLREARKSIK